MLTIQVELPGELEDELLEISRSNGNDLNGIAREALMTYLEDREDYRLAEEVILRDEPTSHRQKYGGDLAWTIEFSTTAERQLAKFDKQVAESIVDYMEQRIAPMDNPRDAGKPLRGQLKGLWRYRVGDYRVLTEIKQQIITIEVVEVGHRSEVYDR